MAGYIGFSRPSLAEIDARVLASGNDYLPGTNVRVEYSPLNQAAKALVGVSHDLHGKADWIARQTNLIDCSDENLDKIASIWGVSRKTASYATGTVTFTGTIGSVIPTDVVLSANNIEFVTTTSTTLTTTTATISVKAIEPGFSSNLITGSALTVGQTLPGINTQCIVVTLSGGTDEETDDALRARALTIANQPAHGGAAFDYVNWALEVPGVTRAWCYPQEMGSGSVTVRFLMDDTYSDGIPAAGDITTVFNYINDSHRRPVTAQLYVVAPIATPLNITIQGISPDTPTIRANVLTELKSMLKYRASPAGTIRLSWIWEAVSQATGTTYHVVASPAADVVCSTGQMPVIGTVTYV